MIKLIVLESLADPRVCGLLPFNMLSRLCRVLADTTGLLIRVRATAEIPIKPGS